MFDWITWSVEAVGVAILLLWVVMPIREFADISRRLLTQRNSDRRRDRLTTSASSDARTEAPP